MNRRSPILCILFLMNLGVAYAQPTSEKPLNVILSPAEVESMLFLYNQTPVKGADVELVAPVGTKLRAGLRQARTQQDSTKDIVLPLTLTEIQVCLGIIQASTFEAKYAELVLGIKRKLEAFAGQPGASAAAASDENGGKKK
jgi:hypothetical protein